MNECRGIRGLLPLRPDDWSAKERERVEAHLAACPDCAAIARAYAGQDRLIRAAPRVGLTPSQRGQLLSHIQCERRRNEMCTKRSAIFSTAAFVAALIALAFGLRALLPQEGQPTPGALPGQYPTGESTFHKDLETTLIALILPRPEHPAARCGWEVLGEAEQELYLWVACRDSASAASLPAVVRFSQNEAGVQRVQEVEIPEDGILYGESVQRLFPPDVILYGESVQRLFPPDVQERIFADDFDLQAIWEKIGVQATLGLFSGRPDPTWLLSPVEEVVLRQKLDQLPSTDRSFDETEWLPSGYHGLQLRLPAVREQPQRHVEAFKGIMRVETEGQVTWLADEEMSLERWMLESATEHVEPDVITIIEAILAELYPVATTPTPSRATHVIQEGDTLLSIATQYGVSAETILAANGLDDGSLLEVGQELVIPTGEVMSEITSLAKGYFQWPTTQHEISGWIFDDPRNPGHIGLDIAAETGAPVFAADGGVVISAGWEGDYGRLVVLEHGNGWSSRYGQLDEIVVQVGQEVEQGELVGRAGSTGNSSGPHLHFELRYQNHPVDPKVYLPSPTLTSTPSVSLAPPIASSTLFTVCQSSETWTRPGEAEQAAQVWDRSRHRGVPREMLWWSFHS